MAMDLEPGFFKESESTKNLDEALAKAQAMCEKAKKDGHNVYFKSNYPTLNAVREASHPALEACGLFFSSYILGDGLLCRLSHAKSGESRTWISPYLLTKRDSQSLGSCVSYLRRYNQLAVLNLGEQDDDGNDACDKPVKQSPRVSHTVKPVRPNVEVYEGTTEQKKILAKIFEDSLVTEKREQNEAHQWFIKHKTPMADLEKKLPTAIGIPL